MPAEKPAKISGRVMFRARGDAWRGRLLPAVNGRVPVVRTKPVAAIVGAVIDLMRESDVCKEPKAATDD